MEAHLVPFGEGHLLVSEAGVFALAEEAKKAEALGREAYALLALPVVPLVVGSYRRGYHEGVLHVASLEEHLQALPRVLSPADVDRIAAFLRGEGERPEVRLLEPGRPESPVASPSGERLEEAAPEEKARTGPPPPPQGGEGERREARLEGLPQAGEASPRGRVLTREREAFPPSPRERRSPLVPLLLLAASLPLVLYPAWVGAIPGALAFFPALNLVLVQDRLLKRGGPAREYVSAFKGLLFGLALVVLLGGGSLGVLLSLAGGLAWALLPALYGVAAGLRPLPLGHPARLYAQAVGDALGPAALLAPVALLYAVPLGLALAALGLLALLGGHLGED
ncbi:hypothetical protein TthHB5008_b22160 (plasmid) [Thermus thermophilus]|uniref:hypothetical protein n=1 Tax=Thermus thermophilus TaxID=274 RepID=UPI0019504193|nr:hypothetical protein [Thermus thermophilus]BCP99144.1 hypothetical protein TthHB5002_b22470 [Thermus thermophilus]BCQ01446.1 hypothetical protein TthHB5008_b22160 [Thermus thermophilus]